MQIFPSQYLAECGAYSYRAKGRVVTSALMPLLRHDIILGCPYQP